jgi:hypothetical protein
MNTFLSLVLIGIVFGGLIYYWVKARVMGIYWVYVVFVILAWPIGALVGIYWALEDLSVYYRGKPLIKSDDKDSKYSLKD